METNEKDNLELWNKVEKTNPEFTSEAKISGRDVTSVDAYTQIKEATKHFGPYGQKWGLKHTAIEFKEFGETTLCIYQATFEYPDGSFPIYNSIKVAYKTAGASGYFKIDDDFAKKVETNTITKALSKLGFNADIFMGKFEDSMYLGELEQEFADQKLEEYKTKLLGAKTIKELGKIFSALPIAIKAELEALKNELKAKLQ